MLGIGVMYWLTVLFASNTVLSILHDQASSIGTQHNHNYT